MTSENHGTIKADQAMVMSPTGSTSQAAPLSPSTSKPIQELPGLSSYLSLSVYINISQTLIFDYMLVCFRSLLKSTILKIFHLRCLCPVCLMFVSRSDELIQAGWAKCWSKRENRPYYFNRFTNQSLWEMPVLGQHDVIVSCWMF